MPSISLIDGGHGHAAVKNVKRKSDTRTLLSRSLRIIVGDVSKSTVERCDLSLLLLQYAESIRVSQKAFCSL